MTATVKILPVKGAKALFILRGLLQEYWNSFGFTPCFQNFSTELAGLPGEYTPPRGRLAMAYVDGQPAGCIALRPVDAHRAEVKRLFVRPDFRCRALGRGLVEWVIAEARTAGYIELIGDTLPVMREAIALYDSIGFERTSGPGGIIDLRFKL